MCGLEPEAAGLDEHGLRLEEQLRHRQRRRHNHQRPGSHLDHHAHEVEQQLSSRTCSATNGNSRRARPVRSSGGRRTAPVPAPCRMRTIPSKRIAPSMLTTDLALRFDPAYEKISRRFMENPGPARRRVRPGVVQADAPRHGPARALSRPGGSRGRTHLAGPDPRGESQIDRCRGHRLAEEQNPGFRSVRFGAGFDRLGLGLHVPRFRQARRCKRRPHSPGAAEGLGGQPACPTGEGAEDSGRHPECVQRLRSLAARRFRWRT